MQQTSHMKIGWFNTKLTVETDLFILTISTSKYLIASF